MFTNRLPDDIDYRVVFSDYANRHFLKRFEKDYKGKRWLVTQKSILAQLRRVHALQDTQQVDQLFYGNGFLIFKYDFAVAQTHISAKKSGNRCVIFLDKKTNLQTILVIYGKTDLPKNQNENSYIQAVIKSEFAPYHTLITG